MSTVPSGGTSVMARRVEPADSLDYFPTPPWATRALCEHVLIRQELGARTCWEPAAGEGIMADVLQEYFGSVYGTDIHDYGVEYDVLDFLSPVDTPSFDYIITNPPFRLAADFALTALRWANRGVCLLTRSAWLEGGGRYNTLFGRTPPTIVALFSERVAMVKGRWDPKASSATSYAWVVWLKSIPDGPTTLKWIPPGTKTALTRPDDEERFA